MSVTTDILINDLKALTRDFSALLNEESSAIRAAKFAHAIGLQDRKIALHSRLTVLLDTIKKVEKSDAQKEDIRVLLQAIIGTARTNQSALEIGFGSIERLVTRIVSIVRRTVDKDTPRYTAHGGYHANRTKSLVLQTDRMA